MKNRILLPSSLRSVNRRMRRPAADPAIRRPSSAFRTAEKTIPQSALMSESPISPTNLDDYLFLDDVLYFDLRSPRSWLRGLRRQLYQRSVLRRAGRLSARGQCLISG